jgi:DNA-directed RNA polymerase specialized sigma24 family protein
MAADPLESLRLTLMQDVLPVGMAMVERARRGGPRELAEVFSAAEDPLGRLRQEGDAAARELRDSLDRLQPGLGNPVVKVQVRDLPDPDPAVVAAASPEAERQELQRALERIGARLVLLEQRLTPSV